MNYYSEYGKEYIKKTMKTDMSFEYGLLEKYLKPGAAVLDICFGYNKGERNPLLMDLVESYCKAKGLTYKENFPYSGAMTLDEPCPHQVTSLMIEINKRVYL